MPSARSPPGSPRSATLGPPPARRRRGRPPAPAGRVRIDLICRGAGRVGYPRPGRRRASSAAPLSATRARRTGSAPQAGRSRTRTDRRRRLLEDNGFEHDPELDEAVRRDGIRSLIVTPLTGEEGMLGVLQVGGPKPARSGRRRWGSRGARPPGGDRDPELAADRGDRAITRGGPTPRPAEQALREIAARITAIRDPAELLKQVVDAAATCSTQNAPQLDLVDPGSGLIRWTTSSGERETRGDRPGDARGRPGRPRDQRPGDRPAPRGRTGDYLTDERFDHIADADEFVADMGIKSVVAAPLFPTTACSG